MAGFEVTLHGRFWVITEDISEQRSPQENGFRCYPKTNGSGAESPMGEGRERATMRAIDFGLNNDFEANARYRLAILYFMNRTFAQAKHHLEAALQMPEEALSVQLRKNIYQQMSRVCHYLGELEDERNYSKLAQSS